MTKRPGLLRAWWPAFVWIGLITFESTDYMSAQNTSSLLYRLLTRVFGPINIYDFLYWHHYLRKAGHIVGFAILAWLLWRGFRATLSGREPWLARPAMLAWLGTAFVAALDEWHQSFLPSRGASAWDVLLDSVAGFAALAVLLILSRQSQPDHEAQPIDAATPDV